MSEAPRAPAVFATRAVVVLVLVSVLAFAGLAVLAAFAPDLRLGQSRGAHAVSKDAVGYAGAVIMLKALDTPVRVSREPPLRPPPHMVVLAPNPGTEIEAFREYPKGQLTLIILPKWRVAADPVRPGRVLKADLLPAGIAGQGLLGAYARQAQLVTSSGVSRPVLRGVARPFAGQTFTLGPIDRLRTLQGQGWEPLLVDERGRAVLARSRRTPSIWVLADPDLLNNHGLASRATAGAGVRILQTAAGSTKSGEVVFDVTLNGLGSQRSLGRLLLTPPWLAATLCGVAAAVLLGLQAFARFGPEQRPARALALGSTALVENSAGLFRMARREHELAPAYAALTQSRLLQDLPGRASAESGWLDELAARRGAESPDALAAKAAGARTSADALAAAQTLYRWRKELRLGRK